MSLGNLEGQTRSDEELATSPGIHKTVVPTPEQFVSKYGGKRVINKILIANNGIAGRTN